ncbi:MAG: efflux RND transporter periplasmic adaptor subunit [Alphaproteobacteria bacterium]
MVTRFSLLLAGIVLAGPAAAQQPPAAPAVGVVKVAKEAVTETASFVGRIEAIDRVEIRARVSGFLEKRAFTEGAEVKAGDLLFVIDQASFKAELDQAKAQLAQGQASAQNAAIQLARAQQLIRTQTVAQTTLDDRTAADQEAKAEVLKQRAALRAAEIQLGYTEIKAPVDGRIGRASASQGNLVGPDTGALALLVSQDPMYVTFPISQRTLLQFQERARAAGIAQAAGQIKVRLRFANGTAYPHLGTIDFVGVSVDRGTDTVSIRARMPNPDRVLIDGQFVSVTVEGDKPEERIMVSQSAVMLDQQGAYVFVEVGGKAEPRRIKLGQTRGGRAIVEEGLSEGDMLIVDGLQRVRPGQPVRATPYSPPASSAVGGSSGR